MAILKHLLMFVAILVALWPVVALGQERLVYAYSVKFICGYNYSDGNGTATLVAGAYVTEINIQRASNAFSGRIEIVGVRAHSIFSDGPGDIGRVFAKNLEGPETVRIICQDVFNLIDGRGATGPFSVGFLRITSSEPLSVVGVYTVKECARIRGIRGPGPGRRRHAGCSGEVSLDVVPYEPILVETFGNDGPPDGPDEEEPDNDESQTSDG